MGKSFRKHDIIGNAGSGVSEKYSKRIANRALRHRVRILIKKDPENEIFPIIREVSDVWDFTKDGKHWFGNLLYEHSTLYPHEKHADDAYWIKVYREFKMK